MTEHSTPDAADRKPEATRKELFDQYWKYATHLRNWFIAYGIGGVLLLTRTDAVFGNLCPQVQRRSILLFIGGVTCQVFLAFINKVAHFYSFAKEESDTIHWYHRAAKRVCSWFWIDLLLDIGTLGFYVWATVELMVRL